MVKENCYFCFFSLVTFTSEKKLKNQTNRKLTVKWHPTITPTVYPIMQSTTCVITAIWASSASSRDLRCQARVSAGNNGIKSAVDPPDLLIPRLAHIKRSKEDHKASGNNFKATEGN